MQQFNPHQSPPSIRHPALQQQPQEHSRQLSTYPPYYSAIRGRGGYYGGGGSGGYAHSGYRHPYHSSSYPYPYPPSYPGRYGGGGYYPSQQYDFQLYKMASRVRELEDQLEEVQSDLEECQDCCDKCRTSS